MFQEHDWKQDQLGKFEEKADEGFLVGYSLNSKAFKVYNLDTKRVEENLHVNFLENKPNVAGKGPTWLFDLDYLTDSMNYQPVRSENQANKFAGPKEANRSAGTQDNVDTGYSEKEAEPAQEYCVLPIWSSYTSTIKSSEVKNGGKKSNEDTGLKSNEKPINQEEQAFLEELERLERQEKEANDAAKALRKEFAQSTEDLLHQAGAVRDTSTNSVNTVSTPVSTASVFSTGGPSADYDDSQIHALEDIYENASHGIFNNTSYDDEGAVTDFINLENTVNVSPIPTSRIHTIHPKSQILGDPTSAVQTRSKVNKTSGAYALIEPKKISEALKDKSWVDAMDSFYQMDMKSAFLYSTIDEEVYVSQPPGFIDPKYPKKVYKVVKALYGLHQAPKAWYATLSAILEKSGYRRGTIDKTLFIKKDKKDIMLWSVKTASTPIETHKPLVKDEEAADVDVHPYKSMIGSLMYLTASRPDIMFAVCACSRFQVTPKTLHLQAVKRIFRYLKGKPKLGLWYPRESSFNLVAYSDNDSGGANYNTPCFKVIQDVNKFIIYF
ncbi:putative ribonuclease H-like domain-containing protein [Tanacetum coccineum]